MKDINKQDIFSTPKNNLIYMDKKHLLASNASSNTFVKQNQKVANAQILSKNMLHMSNLIHETFYHKSDTERKNPVKLVKFCDSEVIKSQKLYKYTTHLSEYVSKHLKEMSSDIADLKKINQLQLTIIKSKNTYQDYCSEIKSYKELSHINSDEFKSIKEVLLKENYLVHLAKVLSDINTKWLDISYGSGEACDIRNFLCEKLSNTQINLASVSIKANTAAVFQNKKFLNYLFHYASDKEKQEFKEVNDEFVFIPKNKLDLIDIPSSEYISKEELQIELNKTKNEIWQELKILCSKNEELITELAKAITTEEEFQERERKLSEEYNQQKTEIISEYEDKLKNLEALFKKKEAELSKEQEETISKIRLEEEKKFKVLEEEKEKKLIEVKKTHEEELREKNKRIQELEEDQVKYLKMKEDIEHYRTEKEKLENKILELEKLTSDYEKINKIVPNKIEKAKEKTELNFDDSDEEDMDYDLIELNHKASDIIGDFNQDLIKNNLIDEHNNGFEDNFKLDN